MPITKPLMRLVTYRLRHPSTFLQASHLLWLFLVALIGATVMVAPAYSAVTLRVDARPVTAPTIKAQVTVTDERGVVVTGLTAAAFSLLVDGVPVVGSPTVTLPPAQNTNQKVSVVFAMDYSGSVTQNFLAPMEDAVIEFINKMEVGDYAAIVKFNATSTASVVKQFTEIDGAAGAGTAALIDAVRAPYPGSGSNILDAVLLSVHQFTTLASALPSGPKAVILLSDGAENSSNADVNAVVNAANAEKIAVFTVGVGNYSSAISQQILVGLAGATSAEFYPAPTRAEIDQAYVQVSTLLNNEYLLTFPSSINDCNSHTLEVWVTGQTSPAIESFTRCTPLLTPDLRGLTRAAATTELTNLGLIVGNVSELASVMVPAGTVISQDPAVGAVVAQGAPVNLVVSSGAPQQSGGGAIDPTELAVGLLLFAALLASRKRKAIRS